MITAEQIRAARGLLGWTQLDMAKTCRLSKTAVNNIERGLVKPRSGTLEIIRKKFEERGVEFFDEFGVNLRKEIFRINVRTGPESMSLYLRDVIDTLRGTGQQALHSNIDESLMIRRGYRNDLYQYYKDFMRYGLRERLLICEGDTTCYAPPETSQYRWISKELFSQNGYSVYGNKCSIFTFDKTIRVITIESPSVTDVYRRQFEFNWKNARRIQEAEYLFYEDRKKDKNL